MCGPHALEERDTELECEDGEWDVEWEVRWWSGGCGREVGGWQRMREDIQMEEGKREEEGEECRRKRESARGAVGNIRIA